MKAIIEARRKDWKQYLLSHLKKVEKPHEFMKSFIYYYLFYTKGTRELHQRLIGILRRMDEEISNISEVRKGDFDVKWLKKIEELLKNIKLNIEKSRE